MKKENLSYEEAMARLEELVRRIESNETGIDQLARGVEGSAALGGILPREALCDGRRNQENTGNGRKRGLRQFRLRPA